MTQDFASKRRTGKPRRNAVGKRGSAGKPPWAWFFSGLASGIFLCGLVWLGYQQPDLAAIEAAGPGSAGTTSPTGEESGPRFDFYTLLPRQSVEVEVDPEEIASARNNRNNEQYLLQAGSFKLAEDADRRRAELILLGLEAHVEEADVDNERWFRVYIGPFESRSRLAQVRGLTAQQGIDTELRKKPRG